MDQADPRPGGRARRREHLSRLLNAVAVVAVVGLASGSASAAPGYPWLDRPAARRLVDAIAAPEGFTRVPVEAGTYSAWLRELPMAAAGAPVRSYAGEVIDDDPVAVIDLDVGTRDLQQCADSILRLRAEYLWAAGRADDVAFHATDGSVLRWSAWAAGERPQLKKGRIVGFSRTARPDTSRTAFRRYLDVVFGWAGTASLEAYTPQSKLAELRPGDFLVLGGFPGHAILVLDVAEAPDGRRRVLIGQGYMPAQSFHVVASPTGAVWHDVDAASEGLRVPTWRAPFPWSSLRRFPERVKK